MPFELTTPTAATLNSVTPRTEKHGDEDVFAISLGLTITGANTLLDRLSPTLRTTLYKPAEEAIDTLPGIEQSTPLLRTHGIELLSLKGALQGWTLRVDHGIDEDDPITIGDCKVDHFRVKPSEGGSVDLLFRIGSSDIDAEEAGLLCSLLRQEIQMTLAAPKPLAADATEATGAEIDGTVGHPGARELDATDLFAASVDAEGEDHEGEPEQLDGAGPDDDQDDDDGGSPDLEDRLDGALAEADAELEAGMQQAISAAGVKPRRGRKTAASLQ